MPEANAAPAIFDEAPPHPEENRSEFDLRVGTHITLQGKARITPAGLICSGLAVAMVTCALAYLARSVPRRRRQMPAQRPTAFGHERDLKCGRRSPV